MPSHFFCPQGRRAPFTPSKASFFAGQACRARPPVGRAQRPRRAGGEAPPLFLSQGGEKGRKKLKGGGYLCYTSTDSGPAKKEPERRMPNRESAAQANAGLRGIEKRENERCTMNW